MHSERTRSVPEAIEPPSPDVDERRAYRRMAAGLVAASRHFAAASPGAYVQDEPGISIAVFPAPPDRSIYNSALLDRGLNGADRAAAIDAMEGAYALAGIDGYAAWTHESDLPLIDDLVARGYRLAESTRAMSASLADVTARQDELDVVRIDWAEHLRIIEAPEGLLSRFDPRIFRVYAARLEGRPVVTAIAFDHDGDCGVYNVGTVPDARRRGLATALTAFVLADARSRGCTTASLQATPAAEAIYASVGFHDLGRIHEYARGSTPLHHEDG
jgi:ribosomal protein S18 acetylase RimI-like enzyme